MAILVDNQLSLINTSDWQCYASITDCLYYDYKNGIIYTTGVIDEIRQVGYYTEYDLNDLMEMAKEQVGNLQLTDEDKEKYGIS